MNHIHQSLAAGLWFVGVPIGTARDITLRALDVLASADLLVAEDTRSLRKLLEIHGVPLAGRRIEALHEHTKSSLIDRLITQAKQGSSVAYASEAGMPLIADPGFELVRSAREANVAVTCAPGPSAVLTALVVGGLPTDAFHFAGFLPASTGSRKKALTALMAIPATVVIYESPKRVGALLQDAAEILGPSRKAVVCRELTKRFEETQQGSLAELATYYQKGAVKGEIVVLIDRRKEKVISPKDIDDSLTAAFREMSIKDASAFVSETFDVPRRQIYQRALTLANKRNSN